MLALALAALSGCGTEGGPGEPLRLTVNKLPPAYLGERYDEKIPAAGGVRPYSYELEGKLPEGLRFADGRIYGTPKEKGTFDLTVVVSDAALSSRSVSYALKVTDPPPPKITIKLPEAETDAPFIAVVTLSDRPTQAFRMRLSLKDLAFDPESVKADAQLLYVLRYDEKQQVLDIDGAFTRTFRGGEVLRFRLEPARKLRPKIRSQAQFFKPDGTPYTPKPPKRPPDRGAYDFDDLRALAKAWGKPVRKAPALKAQPPKNETEGTTSGSEPAPLQTSEDAPSSPEGTGGQSSPPAFEPDLNGDGKVNAEDLDLLRLDYAFNPGGADSKTPAQPESGEDGNPEREDVAPPDQP